MKSFKISILFIFTLFSSLVAAEMPSIKSFSIPTSIPQDVTNIIKNDSPVDIASGKALTWHQDGHNHYLLQVQYKAGGCRIIDLDEDGKSYKDLAILPYCKITGKPSVVDWTDNGIPGISIKIRTRRSSDDYEHDIFLAYLYVPEKSIFCRNTDAESFATGFRVPNSVHKFKASDCE